jgi:RNA-directed DNA polymerase
MNASACASTDNRIQWVQIIWTKCKEVVRKLQVRIVKAQQARKYGRVKALQWLLTHSFSGKLLSVKKVTSNKGKHTPGVDKIVWSTDEEKMEGARSLNRRGYKAMPLRRVYIPKKNSGKKRPLGIPVMKDRAMQALYLMALGPVAETICSKNVYGFRKARSTADAIKEVFNVLSTKNSAKWVLEGDIKGCFDNINHEWLLKNIPTDKHILRQWLKSGLIFKGKFDYTEAGTPQGGIISPCLAVLALNGLEEELKGKFKRKTTRGKTVRPKVNIIAYADDFIITGDTEARLRDEIMPVISSFMKERGLELSAEKTLVTHIDDGFDFLGKNVRKYHGKLLIKPSQSNIKAFLGSVCETIKKCSTVKQEDLIEILSSKIQGWANYHRHMVSKKAYSYVDYQIFKRLWFWACRRHNNKTKKWIKERYFHTIGTRQWVFAAKDGTEFICLKNASDTRILRHQKIRGDANPYDKEWETYFEEREGYRLFEVMSGRQKLIKMWNKQKGICPVCETKVTKETGWRMHFEAATNNKTIIHPGCHESIHGFIQRPAETAVS